MRIHKDYNIVWKDACKTRMYAIDVECDCFPLQRAIGISRLDRIKINIR